MFVINILAVVVSLSCVFWSAAAIIPSDVIVRDNVVFYKTNEISTTRAKWLATIVIDFNELEQLMARLRKDLELVKALFDVSKSRYFKDNEDFEAFKNTFEGLHQEVLYRESAEVGIKNDIAQLSPIANPVRKRRSLLPFVGGALSWLFGTVSESDLKQIRKQISSLALNQCRIIHVVEQGLTIINESRVLIRENRQSIIEIIGSIREMDVKINQVTHELARRIKENRRFLELYARIDLLIDEINVLIHNARSFLTGLRAQLDYLALGKLSTRIINPLRLRQLLLETQESASDLMALITNPKTGIWSYYKYLTTTTFFLDGKIIIVIAIPMLKLDTEYKVYKVISIPILPPVTITHCRKSENTEFLATNKLESNGFLIDKARTKYQLLTDSEIQACSHKNARFCTV